NRRLYSHRADKDFILSMPQCQAALLAYVKKKLSFPTFNIFTHILRYYVCVLGCVCVCGCVGGVCVWSVVLCVRACVCVIAGVKLGGKAGRSDNGHLKKISKTRIR